ncbi:MAG: hypothetical protein SGILL_001161 [Bacillariaceae sp.]
MLSHISLFIASALLLCLSSHNAIASSYRHLYDDNDWERVLQNRKFLTQKGRDENAAKLQKQQGRKLQSDGFHTAGDRTMNVIVALMNWNNHGGRTSLKKADVEKLFMGTGRDEIHPGGSISDYFDTMSQGQFKLNVHVADWVKTTKSETFYTQDGSQGRTQELQEAFEPVMKSLDNKNFDFSKYDSNGDNEIDLTIFLHSGYDGIYPGKDCYTDVSPQDRVASHYRLRSSESKWVSKAGYKLGSYVVSPAYYGNCDYEINGMGVIIHEIIHAFGIPDLYDTGEFASTGYLGGIDRYGIMANPWGNRFNSREPGPIMGWTKMELGWVTPTEIDRDGVYTIGASEATSDLYVIREGYNGPEYLLLENRQAVEGGFDENFFEPGGITIYHVDENVFAAFGFQSNKGNTPKGGPFQPDWPGNGKHYPVALLQADGLYELEQNIDGGDRGDLWNTPDQVLGPGNGETVAKDANYPNTDSYAWGTIKTTGITIKNFQYTQGTTMSFEVGGLGAGSGPSPTDPPVQTDPPPTDAPLSPPTDAPVSPTDAPEPPTDAPTMARDNTETTSAPTAPVAVGCQEATPVVTESSFISGSTVGANHTAGTAFCGANITGPGQWYALNGTGNLLEIDACNQNVADNFTVAVAVFFGTSCGELSCITGSTFADQVCVTTDLSLRGRSLQQSSFLQESSSDLSFATDVGMTYYIFVSGNDPSLPEGSGTSTGDFQLSVNEIKLRTLNETAVSFEALPMGFVDAETVKIISGPLNGRLSLRNTTVTYTSDKEYTGTDQFEVQVCGIDGVCERISVTVEVSAKEEEEEEQDVENNTDGSSSSSNKNVLYILLLLLLLPVIWIYRKQLSDLCSRCRTCPCRLPWRKKDSQDDGGWDPSQPTGKSSRKLGSEQPFKDEEANDGYTDDDDDALIDSEDSSDDSDEEDSSEEEEDDDSSSDESSLNETNESQNDEESASDDHDSDSDDDDDDSQDVQGDSDNEIV